MPSNLTINPRAIRHKLGLNQSDFWKVLGVTQSAGSRYEIGQSMPVAVQTLLRLVYMEKVPLEQINREDLEIGQLLKYTYSELYLQLQRDCQKKMLEESIDQLEQENAMGLSFPGGKKHCQFS